MYRTAVRFFDARNRGSESWYLSANICLGSVKWAWSEQLLSSNGGVLPLMDNSKLGCSPVGRINCEEKCSKEG